MGTAEGDEPRVSRPHQGTEVGGESKAMLDLPGPLNPQPLGCTVTFDDPGRFRLPTWLEPKRSRIERASPALGRSRARAA